MKFTDIPMGKCPKGHDNAYSFPYDYYYCPECDEWLEKGGFNLGMKFKGPQRPEKPSQIDYTKILDAE